MHNPWTTPSSLVRSWRLRDDLTFYATEVLRESGTYDFLTCPKSILSPSDRADTWANVWSYVTIPSVRGILVLSTAEVRVDLLRREADGRPDDPLTLTDTVSLEGIEFTAPVAAFYRTAGE
jgi:hypothetical protein